MILGIGVIIYLALRLAPLEGVFDAMARQHAAIAAVLAGFAFTIAGFLATIATFLFTLADRPYFKVYRSRGSFGDLMFMHLITLVTLAALFCFSLVLIAFPQIMVVALTLTLLGLLELTVLTFASYHLTRRAHDGGHAPDPDAWPE